MDNAVVTQWLTQPGGLASRLRMLRTNKGVKSQDLAARLDWGATKVSKIENGKQLPSPAEIRSWVAATVADSSVADELIDLLEEAKAVHMGWRDRMKSGQAGVQTSYNQLLHDATTIRLFETVYIPGPLQVPEYARRVLTEMITLHNLDNTDIDEAVAERMSRHQLLYDTSKQFDLLITEPVLRWRLCPVPTMIAQLDRLQTVIDLPNVRFGIIPLAGEISVTPQNSFGVYDELVIVDTFVGEIIYDEGDEAETYSSILDQLWKQAVSGGEARQLIVQIAGEYRNDTPG